MRKSLEKMVASKEAKIKELRAKMQESEDVVEVRRLGETLEEVYNELAEAKRLLEELDEPKKDGNDDGNVTVDVNEGRNLNVMATMQSRAAAPATETEDVFGTKEYRKAFMQYCTKGTPIPAEYRDAINDVVTTTSDASVVIPTTVLDEIISEFQSYGNLYDKVRKLQIQGGVQIPILTLKPTATWITANTGTKESGTQKIQVNQAITFNYYGLECKIAQTLLASVTTIKAFEDLFIPLAADAMAKALDIAIMNGTGVGQPTGITVDSRVPAANKIALAPTDITSWSQWKKQVFAKMKKSYREGIFYMAQATFDGYIDGMTDTTGQPIGRVNYGIDGGENYRFGGKPVETVENDVIASYDDAEDGDVIAVFVDPKDYAINSNLTMEVVKWTDNDTNTIKNKVILICDGKLVDPNGVLIITKGAAATAKGAAATAKG